MDIMDITTKKFDSTKEYLNQISRLNRTIDNKMIELSQLRELAYGISAISSGEKVQSSTAYDKVGDVCVKIDEMERNIEKIIDNYIDIKNQIISQIEGIDKEVFYEVLFLRHIKQNKQGKQYSFEEISIEINNSYRNTTRLYKQALQAFEEKYGNEYLKQSESCPIMS